MAVEMDNQSSNSSGDEGGLFSNSPNSMPVNIVILGLAAALIIWTVIGNITVIMAVRYTKALRSLLSNIFICNLALSDLLLGLLVLPFSAMNDVFGYWPLGKEICYMWLLVDILLCTASIWSLLVVAVDRYAATFYPMWYRSKYKAKRTWFFIAMVWVASTITSIPPLLGFGGMSEESYDQEATPTQCRLFDSLDFVLFSSSMTFTVPALVMFVLYGRIFVELRKRFKSRMKKSVVQKSVAPTAEGLSDKEESSSSSAKAQENRVYAAVKSHRYGSDPKLDERQPSNHKPDSHQSQEMVPLRAADSSKLRRKAKKAMRGKDPDPSKRTSLYLSKLRISMNMRSKSKRRERKEERATKIMLTVMLAFIVCWLPFFIMYITRSILNKRCPDCNTIPDVLQRVFTWLGYINSAINPILYTAFNKYFRVAFKTVWCSRCGDRRPPKDSSMKHPNDTRVLDSME